MPDTTPDSLPLINAILAQLMCERGEHSWGMMSPERSVRGTGSLMLSNMVRKLPRYKSVAVHTRFATHGAKTTANAHPFQQGDILGMHNGVIHNHATLNAAYDRRFEVDSQHIFQHLNDGDELDQLEGYGAVVYQRADTPGDYFMGTFNGGELEVARVTYRGHPIGVMWASTEEAITNACSVGRLKVSWVKIEEGKVYRISNGEVYNTDQLLDVGRTYSKPTGARKIVGLASSFSNDDDDDAVFGEHSTNAWIFRDGEWVKASDYAKKAEHVADGMVDADVDAALAMLETPCDSCGEVDACNCKDCYCSPCLARDDYRYNDWRAEAENGGQLALPESRHWSPCEECGWIGLHHELCSTRTDPDVPVQEVKELVTA